MKKKVWGMPELNLISVGLVIILIGFALVFIGSFLGGKNTKVAVGGFIGPIPFGWANDPKMLPWIIALTATVAIIFFVLINRGFL